RTGQEHEQEQAKPIDEVEDVALMLGATDEVRNGRKAAEQGGTQHDSGEDLTNDTGLAQLDKEIAQHLGQTGQEQENEKN
ncbi:MAG: hypothetical protein QOH85_364, partial [Acidobacteriaceae bacterium]|nr:hypothetical protein [Acidobacteriaceae bacterium]